MADEPRPGVAGLGKAFAEFTLLPGLLQASEAGDISEAHWTSLLEEHGFNEDHVNHEDLQGVKRGGLAAFMARDAMRMCERLLLLAPGGLTEAGRRLAGTAAVPDSEQPSDPERKAPGPSGSGQAAGALVGEQIRRHYVGADGLELVPLVQQASARIAAEQQPPWADLPGLLLAEFDTLLYWGLVDAEHARELVEELPRVRSRIRYHSDWNTLRPSAFTPGTFSDVVTFWHYDQESLAFSSTLTMTELRVTAMAMAWSGLLSEEFRDLEVSFLAPVGARA